MKKYKFAATIEQRDGERGTRSFPLRRRERVGTKGREPVKATFKGVPYAGRPIPPTGDD
jgi:hypothetical protein